MMAKDKTIFLDENKSIGHVRVTQELCDDLDELAKDRGMSRSALMRKTLEAFVLYMYDAKSFKRFTFFNKKPSVSVWLNERNDIHEMNAQVEKYSELIQTVSTPDEKIQLVAAQNNTIARMINLLHRTVMT